MVLELAQHLTLFDFIEKPGPFSEELALYCFKQLLHGLNAIHEQNLCHLDIKCENILLSHKYQLKIADFTYARDPEKCNERVGTQLAPEVMSVEVTGPFDGVNADMFNMGFVLFTMLFAKFPF